MNLRILRTADILPGQECAILEMADGRRVDLSSARGIESLQIEGIMLKNDSNVLSYEGGAGGDLGFVEI